MSMFHSFRFAAATAAIGVFACGVSSCDTVSPAKVCTADETVRTVRSVLMTAMLAGADSEREQMQQAFDELVRFELVRFDGYNRETKVTNCRAKITTEEGGAGVEISYYRQPDIASGGFVYGIGPDLNSNDPGWMPIALVVGKRYRELVANPRSATAKPASAPVAAKAATSTTNPSKNFSRLELEGYDGVVLGSFEEWARERDGGSIQWEATNAGYRMHLSWKYGNGNQTTVIAQFENIGNGRVRLGETTHDGESLSMQGADEVIGGVTLDMYQRGIISYQ